MTSVTHRLPVSSAIEMSFLCLVVERVIAAKDFIGNSARGPDIGLRVVQVGENTLKYNIRRLKKVIV